MNKNLGQCYKQKINQILSDDRIYNDSILGIFVYGSQALGLNNEQSDIDTLVLIRPTLENLFDGISKVKEITYSNNEKVVIRPVTSLVKGLERMEMQLVEAFHTPIYISDEFRDEFQLLNNYLQSDDAKATFQKTLFFYGDSFVRNFEKGIVDSKNMSKIHLYYNLNLLEKPLFYYQKNKAPGGLRETYFKIKNEEEFLSEEKILSIQDYYKNNKDVLLKKYKNLYKNNYNLYELKSLMIKNTLSYYLE